MNGGQSQEYQTSDPSYNPYQTPWPASLPSSPGVHGPPVPGNYPQAAPQQANPFGGGLLPEGFPEQPDIGDFTYTDTMGGSQVDQEGFYSATESWYTWAADFAKYGEQGFDGDGGRGQDLSAQYLASHVQATIAAMNAEIEAGRLNLEQAEAVFNARMDAFAEAGKQRSDMWKWTVPPGSEGKPLHADIREGLGMQSWISQPMTIDPFAEAQEIVADMPAMTPVSADQMQDIVDLTGSFLGR